MHHPQHRTADLIILLFVPGRQVSAHGMGYGLQVDSTPLVLGTGDQDLSMMHSERHAVDGCVGLDCAPRFVLDGSKWSRMFGFALIMHGL